VSGEELLSAARKHLWAAWALSQEEIGSQAAATLLGLGTLVPEGGAQELERAHNDLDGARLSLYEEEQENARLRLAWKSARLRAQAYGEGVVRHVADRDFWKGQCKAAEARVAELEALELCAVDGRVSATCGDPAHPTWLRAKDDLRGCPWCRVSELEAERHSTNEALDDAVQALREREQQDKVVADFVAGRAEYITAIRNCHPDNGHDYDRWQGHAAARRQLAELLGLPVAWPAEDAKSVERPADKLTALLAPTQALQDVPDGEHAAWVRHDYRTSHDLPEMGGAS
jgi:hypothetical protein